MGGRPVNPFAETGGGTMICFGVWCCGVEPAVSHRPQGTSITPVFFSPRGYKARHHLPGLFRTRTLGGHSHRHSPPACLPACLATPPYPPASAACPAWLVVSSLLSPIDLSSAQLAPMGRAPCCDKASVKKGPWSPEEDAKLKAYIDENGTGGNWIALPQKIGMLLSFVRRLVDRSIIWCFACFNLFVHIISARYLFGCFWSVC